MLTYSMRSNRKRVLLAAVIGLGCGLSAPDRFLQGPSLIYLYGKISFFWLTLVSSRPYILGLLITMFCYFIKVWTETSDCSMGGGDVF